MDELEEIVRELEIGRGGNNKRGRLDVGQWEIHPWLPRKYIVEWCQEKGAVAYCPLIRGQKMDDDLGGEAWEEWGVGSGSVEVADGVCAVTLERIVENADV